MASAATMMYADETALDFFTRLAYPVLDLLPTVVPLGVRVGETLEVLGESSTGKTMLLMECCVSCILPAGYGGHAAHAVVVDSEGGFNLLRLAHVLTAKLRTAGMPDDDLSPAVEVALTRLRLMQCLNADEMLQGLAALRCELECTQPDDARPRLLLIDSASAFRWLDRVEQQHGCASSVSFETRLDQLLGLLRRQQLSVIWSRCPVAAHQGGLEFPIIDRTTISQWHAELNQPSMRVRLRRLDLPSTPTPDVHHHATFQTLLDNLNGAASVADPPARRILRVTMNGVAAC